MPRQLRTQAICAAVILALCGVLVWDRAVRAADAQKEATASSKAGAKYVGRDTCVGCHEEVAKKHQDSVHGKLLAAAEAAKRGWDCEGCHGPGSAHADSPADVKPPRVYDPKKPDTAAAMCISCHNTKVSPARWRMSQHGAAGVRCWDCHAAGEDAHGGMTHRPSNQVCLKCHREVEGQFTLNTHHPVREGRMDCADCHNPHKRQQGADYADTCRKCHKNARGPFIFTHGALESRLTDVCVECHMPHGSPNARMLKLPGRSTCLQCHADKAVQHFPGDCLDCHQAQHGSNTSPLLFTP